jgi:hypothetical protein
MNYDSVRTNAEVKLSGISVDIEKRGAEIYSITLSDAQGNSVKVAKADYNSIAVLVPALPKKEKKFAVTGKLLGVADVNEVFNEEYEAQGRLNEIVKAASYPDDPGITVEPVEVEVQF